MDKIVATPFMTTLAKDLMAERKDKDGNAKPGVAESSAISYIKSLYNLNGKEPFKSLGFLKDTLKIDGLLEPYAEATKKTLLGIIVGTLMLKKSGYSKALNHYKTILKDKSNTMRTEEDKNEKTQKQKDNWMSMEDINKIKDERWKALTEKMGSKAKITAPTFDALLNYLIVSLYTDNTPRRNQDYMKMVVVKKWKEGMPKDANYYDVAGNRFIFNVYKTSRKYGQHIVNIPDALLTVLKKYMKYHPHKTTSSYALLVKADGTPLTAVNSITRVLNRFFGKNLGSSMLRHIFLSEKYNIDEMKKDAEDMGHSVSQQKAYMKTDEDTNK